MIYGTLAEGPRDTGHETSKLKTLIQNWKCEGIFHASIEKEKNKKKRTEKYVRFT